MHIYIHVGKSEEKSKEDSPLINDNEQLSRSIELSPSPPKTTPVHVQFPSGDKGHLIVEEGRDVESY